MGHVANIIAAQITHQTFVMFGAHHILDTGGGLQFKVRGSKYAQSVRVTLDPSDTYTVEYYKRTRASWGGGDWTLVHTDGMVYADQLRNLLGTRLGLAVSL